MLALPVLDETIKVIGEIRETNYTRIKAGFNPIYMPCRLLLNKCRYLQQPVAKVLRYEIIQLFLSTKRLINAINLAESEEPLPEEVG